MPELTHFDDSGDAHMVDVSQKAETYRVAVAEGRVTLKTATLALIRDHAIAKGDVLEIARLAGIMATKRTSDLIPLCHPLRIASVDIELVPHSGSGSDDGLRSWIDIRASVTAIDRTGVEMEAMTAVMTTGLVIYDMCKSVDREMTVSDVRLIEKSGGKSGHFQRPSLQRPTEQRPG